MISMSTALKRRCLITLSTLFSEAKRLSGNESDLQLEFGPGRIGPLPAHRVGLNKGRSASLLLGHKELRKSSLIGGRCSPGIDGKNAEDYFAKAIDCVEFLPEYELVDSQ